MKSKCCNKPLRLSRENPEPGETMYYICDGCNQPADPKCDHGDHIVCNECTDPDCEICKQAEDFLKPAGDVAQFHLGKQKNKWTQMTLRHDFASLTFWFEPKTNKASGFQVLLDNEQQSKLVSRFTLWQIIKLKWKYRKGV